MTAGFVPHSEIENNDWSVWRLEDGRYNNDAVMRAGLLDIRKELRKLNALIGCHNFVAVPRILRRISANTAKPRKKKAVRRAR